MTKEQRKAAIEALRWLDDYAWHTKCVIGCAERLRFALMSPRDQERNAVPPELRPKFGWWWDNNDKEVA